LFYSLALALFHPGFQDKSELVLYDWQVTHWSIMIVDLQHEGMWSIACSKFGIFKKYPSLVYGHMDEKEK
jgi:hypothetical protein